MKNYIRISQKIYKEPWAVKPDVLDSIATQFQNHIKGGMPMDMPDDMEQEPPMEIPDQEENLINGTYVVNVSGVIGKKLSMMETMCGGCDVDEIKGEIQEALDKPEVERILLVVDSPGGTVTGVKEFADFLFEAKNQKPIFCYTDTQMCSAAYWIGSQCNAVFCSESATVGSVGVYLLLMDESKALENAGVKVNPIFKGDNKLSGASFKPLTDEERAMFQKDIDKTYNQFTGAILRNRSIDSKYLQGWTYDGEDSLKYGFVDGIANDINEVITVISSK